MRRGELRPGLVVGLSLTRSRDWRRYGVTRATVVDLGPFVADPVRSLQRPAHDVELADGTVVSSRAARNRGRGEIGTLVAVRDEDDRIRFAGPAQLVGEWEWVLAELSRVDRAALAARERAAAVERPAPADPEAVRWARELTAAGFPAEVHAGHRILLTPRVAAALLDALESPRR